ncbi:MAG: hypothetical protein J6W54_03460 [Fibrobacter sp.]|uniref:hypothetical protein n=1 Tax=Fibrobacter sp. TaxID=35828 RepID=UPI001B0C4FF9|nr:hypothetical protein [Fibrobacter sp.]MBO7060141.1 hypothetical protein [Fibrobacter sp.]
MKECPTFEFVSYDGEFPSLCSGILKIRVDGKEYELGPHVLESGGSVSFDENWEDSISNGPWRICEYYELPEELKPFKTEITELVNDNVTFGCCGGCV